MSFALCIDVSEQTWLVRDPGFCEWLKSVGLVPENIYRVEVFPNGIVCTHEYHLDAEGRKHIVANCDGHPVEGRARIRERQPMNDACRVLRDTRPDRPLTIEFGARETHVKAAA